MRFYSFARPGRSSRCALRSPWLVASVRAAKEPPSRRRRECRPWKRVRPSSGHPPLPASLGRPSARVRGTRTTSSHSGHELAIRSLSVFALPVCVKRGEGGELASALSDERAIPRFGHFAFEQLDVSVANVGPV